MFYSPEIITFAAYVFAQFGVSKLFLPERAKISEIFAFPKQDDETSITFQDIKNQNIAKVNSLMVSKFTIGDSVISASKKLDDDFFNVILLISPLFILAFAFASLDIQHPLLLGVVFFLNVLITINRYSTFDEYSKLKLALTEKESAEYIMEKPQMKMNLFLFQNFVFFPVIELFLIYIAFFV